MEVKFNVVGKEERTGQGDWIDSRRKIKVSWNSSAAYKIGNFIVDKEGAVKCEDDFALERLIHNLIADGFIPKEEDISEREATQGLTVALPKNRVDTDKLGKILENKSLIKKTTAL